MFLSNPGDFKGRAVCDRAVAISAGQVDRIIRSDFVEIRSRRERLRLPESFDPSASRNPLAGLGLVDAGFDFGQKIFEGWSSLPG